MEWNGSNNFCYINGVRCVCSEAGRFVRFLNLNLIGISLDDFFKIIFRAKMHAIEQKVLFITVIVCQ